MMSGSPKMASLPRRARARSDSSSARPARDCSACFQSLIAAVQAGALGCLRRSLLLHGAHALPHELDYSRRDRSHDDGDNEQRQILFDHRNIAEIVPAVHEKADPEYAARKAVEHEARVMHESDARNEWRERTHDRQEARKDHGL